MYRTFKTEKNLAPTSREDDQNLNTNYKNLTPVVIIRFMNFVVYYYLLRNDIYTSTGTDGTGSSNLNQSNDLSLLSLFQYITGPFLSIKIYFPSFSSF